MDRDNLLRLAIQVWGEPSQVIMAIEEMSELTKELCKTFRDHEATTPGRTEHILEEIADCKIMIRQMELIFGDAEKYEREKLDRLEMRLNSGIKP